MESSFRFLQKEGGLPDLDDLWRRGSLHRAREGFKQRFLLTGVASGDNEIKQRRNFSETHFPGVAPCRFRLDGHDGNAVWDEAVPMYVTRLGDLIEKSAQRNLF